MTAFTAFCGIAFNASDAESTQHHEAMRSRSGASFRGSGKTLGDFRKRAYYVRVDMLK